ncbi:hypothetical protein BGZ83_009907 [Gryganskiella cystojenkinii]|nr:hypothetical protein BGZ83_009907 [Gryganskiella cystojenkinii]
MGRSHTDLDGRRFFVHASDDDGGSSSYYADEESGEGGYSSDYNDTTLSDESTLDQTHDTQEAKNDEGDEQQSSSVQNRRKRSLSEYEDEVKWYPEIERKSESESDIHNSASEKANREKKVHRDLHMSTTAPVTSESPATKQETTGAITAFITKGRADKVLYAVYSDALEAIQEVTSRKNITELKVSLVVEIANVDGGEEMVVLKETLIF